MDVEDKKKNIKMNKLLMMEYIYVYNFNDNSKRGFVIDQMKTNIFTDDAVFETVLDEFKTACLNNELNEQSKNMISLLDNLDKLGQGESIDINKTQNQFRDIFKCVIPETMLTPMINLMFDQSKNISNELNDQSKNMISLLGTLYKLDKGELIDISKTQNQFRDMFKCMKPEEMVDDNTSFETFLIFPKEKSVFMEQKN